MEVLFLPTHAVSGIKLGTVEMVNEELLAKSTQPETKCAQVTVQTKETRHHSIECDTVTDRQSQLKLQLNLEQQPLSRTPEQVKQLEKVLLNLADVFALSDSELGGTSLV